jgi:DNA (cytosine-5)-methyltransferase 1
MVNGELIVDSFAGGGGASTGIEMALGVSPDIAINHDPEAIAMHAANHPGTRHYIEDVWKVDPLEVCGDRPVGLFWLSPDCTYHSKARGGKPFRDRNEARGRRGLPWLAVYWAEKKRPRIIGMENVEEIEEWGPLLPDGRRNLDKAGFTFRRFVARLEKLGYVVDWRVLKASDYGVPTIRKRLILIARCDGQPIAWPEPTHGPGLLPYRACGDELDFSLPIPSIFEPGRDLCENTLRRIARGIDRYVINDPHPFIVTSRGTSDAHIRSSAHSIRGPLGTITAGRGNHHHLVAATLINTRNGERLGQAPRVRDCRDPYPTITAKGSQGALVTAFLARHYGGHENDGWNLRDPLPTITATDHHALVYAFMVKYYGTEQNPRLDEPLHTITTKDRFALVTIPVGQHAGVYYIADIGMRHLVSPELYRCQGFPRGYIIDPLYNGKRLPKYAQTRMCGNSVPPGLVSAVIGANWFLESTVAEPRQVECA